jgi:voltage-gated potassium channel
MMVRKQLQTFFNKHEVAWEIFMIVLAIGFVIIGFLPDWFAFSEGELETLNIVDWGLTGFFALEFLVRISIALSKLEYLKSHWLDLIAIIPAVRWFRLARIARIIRLLRLARLIRGLNTLDQWQAMLARFARMNGLQWVILGFTTIMLATSGLFFYFEHQVNDKIGNYWDALYASLITWTTPGYGDIAPMTTNGRICGVVLIISGLITWGILIANLSSYLTSRRFEDKTVDPAIHDIQHKLACLNDLSDKELISLKGSTESLIEDARKKQDKILETVAGYSKNTGQPKMG